MISEQGENKHREVINQHDEREAFESENERTTEENGEPGDYMRRGRIDTRRRKYRKRDA